jgi:hypothetical protein
MIQLPDDQAHAVAVQILAAATQRSDVHALSPKRVALALIRCLARIR